MRGRKEGGDDSERMAHRARVSSETDVNNFEGGIQHTFKVNTWEATTETTREKRG
jgi:hypothetical protein